MSFSLLGHSLYFLSGVEWGLGRDMASQVVSFNIMGAGFAKRKCCKCFLSTGDYWVLKYCRIITD